MKISSYSDTKATQELPGVTKREVVNAIDGAPTFCMRVFDLEPGGSTPWHTHNWEHEVYILEGTLVLNEATWSIFFSFFHL